MPATTPVVAFCVSFFIRVRCGRLLHLCNETFVVTFSGPYGANACACGRHFHTKMMKLHAKCGCLRDRSMFRGSKAASTHHHTNLWASLTTPQRTCRADLATVAASNMHSGSTASSSQAAEQTLHASSSSSTAWPAQQQLALVNKRSLLLGLAASIGLSLLPQGAAVVASGESTSVM
jgi:hypothetical protein